MRAIGRERKGAIGSYIDKSNALRAKLLDGAKSLSSIGRMSVDESDWEH